MSRPATVLITDDDPSIRQTMETIVRQAGMKSIAVATGEEALRTLALFPVDVMLLDVQLPGINGLEVLKQVRERSPDVGVIMLSVIKEISVAVQAIQLGAHDYVQKDFSPVELAARVSKSLDKIKADRELAWLRDEVGQRRNKPMIMGRSKTMREITSLAVKVSAKPVTVLITGDSGTGKEVLARYLHDHSDRRAYPFVACNMASIPSELVESTLFGHEKGSFTGAVKQQYGKFELANGGTLFLDEVAELRIDVQAKLLRGLQEREIERVGGERSIQLDLRVICATNRNLEDMVKQGRFRDDLYWRLKVVPIQMPPLRERREDIGELAQHFLGRFCVQHGRPRQQLSDAAVQILETYAWPGNIRELENLIERLVVVSDSAIIEESDLPLELSVAAGLQREAERESSLTAAMSAFEKGYLRKMLKLNHWNRRHTAEHLGIGYSTLKAKLKSYEIGPADGDD